MFGSKLRSWMENHIVRPRKKGNKNKSGNSSNSNFGILTAQNGHAKGASTAEGGTTTTIGSPARRSEVSPIQNHTTSRRGWQSPNQDQLPSLSPRSDDYRQYQYQQQQNQQHHQHYQLQQQQLQSPAPIYGNGTLPSGSGGGYKLSSNGYIPNQNHQQGMSSSPRSIARDGFRTLEAGGNYSKSVDSGNFSTAMYGIKEEGYRKSSGGGGSGVISSGNVMVNTLNYSTATSSSNELLEDLQHIEANRLKRGQHTKISSSSSSSINSNNNNLVNNNSIVGNGNSNNGGLYINNNGFEQQQQQPSRVVCKMAPIVKHQQQVVVQQQHYGSGSCGAYYEQHNSINNNLVYGKHPPVPPPPIPAKSHAVTQLSKNGNRPNNNNNNNNNGFEICTVTSGGGGKSGPTSTGSTLSTFANKFHKLTANRNSNNNNNSFDGKQNHVNNNNNNVHHHQPQPNGHHHQHHHHHAQTTVVVGQPGQPGGGHHNTTLSSPESAYSTGYSSTDGTSPGGCSYTPEYYINIRTGTHYFPKGLTGCSGPAGSGAGAAGAGGGIGGFENGNKFKCGLNRIEERHVEFAVEEQCPSPRKSSSSDLTATTKAISGKGQSSGGTTTTILKNGPSSNNNHNNNGCLSQQQQQQQTQIQQQTLPNAVAMSPVMQKNLGMQHYRSIESPSPRQRCRIRTNPWLSTLDGSLAGTNIKKTELDSGSTTSSGIKSSSGTDDNKKDSKSANALSDSDSSSSTEKVISKKMLTPRSVKKACGDISRLDSKATTYCSNPLDSDEDATLNEMMGKFDESYHYEKETDILSCSDSDPTDCPSDIDTGQDAGDECDTDDLLDLDFIDTGSVVEVTDKEPYRHTGSCSYHNFPERRSSSRHRSGRCKRNSESGGSKRRKKLVRTRKKLAEGGESGSPGGLAGGRGCRSLGGTPVSHRRNQSEERSRERNAPLANRCNSLTFTEVHSLHSRILAISESEKALLKADLEADVKYKQLIHEAESILFSMKTNSMKELKEIKEPPTTICSPRRICNPPANKRVEMLRNCEADLKRELAKTCSQKCAESELNPVEGVIINKRLEVLRYETSISAPNSPKNTRMIPRKTHITNFINQNHCTEVIHRNTENDLKSAKLSPQPQPIYERNIALPKSPTLTRRRFRSQSPKLNIESDSDSDELSRNLDRNSHSKNKSHKENLSTSTTSSRKSITGKPLNNFRHTIHVGGSSTPGEDKPPTSAVVYSSSFNEGDIKQQQRLMHKSPLMSFRSVDMGNTLTDDSYCPQSEPLKRKIYTCSATFEKIQRSLDVDPELSKKALLHKITLLRRERLAKSKAENACHHPGLEPSSASSAQSVTPSNGDADRNGAKNGELSLLNGVGESDFKQQLIMSTLADIKRSLEDQSVELNELNDSDN